MNVKCPFCGSYDCSMQIINSNNLKKTGKIILNIYTFGIFEDKGDYDLINDDDKFECKKCGNLFTLRQSKEAIKNDESVIGQIKKYFNDEDYNNVIQLCDNVLQNSDDKFDAYLYKAWSYKNLGIDCDCEENSSEEVIKRTKEQKASYLKESLANFNYLNSFFDETPSWLYQQKAIVMYCMPYEYCSDDNFYEARRFAIASLSTDDLEDFEESKKLIERLDEDVFTDFELYTRADLNEEGKECANSLKFTNSRIIPSADRQFLILSKNIDKLKGYYDADDNLKWVFPLNKIPSDVHFEGFPQPDTLYIAHPGRPDFYIPYDKSEDYLFDDKIREFEYLMNCLGATKITYKWEQGRKTYDESKSTKKGSGEVDAKAVKINANGKTSSLDASDNIVNVQIGRSHKSDPKNYPYIPNNLVWYPHIDSWKLLAKDRLDNNKLEYEYTFKSSEVSNVSSNRKSEINASFKKLMVKVKGSYSGDETITSNNSEETIWTVKVEFKPLSKFDQTNSSFAEQVFKPLSGIAKTISSFVDFNPLNKDNQLSQDELDYIEEVKIVVADGEISDNDRKRLERRRVQFGLSEERARELEGTIKTNFSDNEKDYYKEMLDVLEDGVIDEKERKSLERLIQRMNISRERANEIEKMVKKEKGLE